MWKEKIIKRNPIVVILGHIDHGKSTLLDYIRKENTVNKEHGGITQHIAAYETEHKNQKITFIDTPGHEAFISARTRGANIADIAILVVSADDGFAEQTKSALKFIKDSKIPFIVAINKIDKPNADINKTKNSLLENEIYLEGMGGDISYTEISAKIGTNVSELLDTILLTAELNELTTDKNAPASGYILESSLDSKSGISATMIIKNGKVENGKYVVSGFSSSPVRIIKNCSGKILKEASASMPINLIGFNQLPSAGNSFSLFENKKEAFKYIQELKDLQSEKERSKKIKNKKITKNKKNVFPIVLRADVHGSLDALKHELSKITNEMSEFKIAYEGIGAINEKCIKAVRGFSNATIIGFNVKVENNANFLADNLNIEIKSFSIIYEIIDFLKEKIIKLTPKEKIEGVVGKIKVLKVFSWNSKDGIIGGEVIEGIFKKKNKVKIFRREEFIGEAIIKELQTGKKEVTEVKEGIQMGLNILSKIEITDGDILESVEIIER